MSALPANTADEEEAWKYTELLMYLPSTWDFYLIHKVLSRSFAASSSLPAKKTTPSHYASSL
ncbi:hypothetical protein ACLD72_005155 [Paenibacillus sp. TH7-28]